MKKQEILKHLLGNKTGIIVYYKNYESEAIIDWKTEEEFNNFINFTQSKLGSMFMNYCLFAITNGYSIPCDDLIHLVMEQIIPHVDWSRPWTVEEILAYRGASKKLIKECINYIQLDGPWQLSEKQYDNYIEVKPCVTLERMNIILKTLGYSGRVEKLAA